MTISFHTEKDSRNTRLISLVSLKIGPFSKIEEGVVADWGPGDYGGYKLNGRISVLEADDKIIATMDNHRNIWSVNGKYYEGFSIEP